MSVMPLLLLLLSASAEPPAVDPRAIEPPASSDAPPAEPVPPVPSAPAKPPMPTVESHAPPASPAPLRAIPALPVRTAPSSLTGLVTPIFAAGMLLQMRYQQTQVTIEPGLGALVNRQYSDPSVAADTLRLIRDTARETDGLRPRRLLLNLAGTASGPLSWQVRFDFAKLLYDSDQTQIVRWAYAEYAPASWVVLTVGVFDIPFSLFETIDEAEIELAERGPTHELLHHMRFTERDLGILVSVYPFKERQWLQAIAGVLNGGADGAQSYRGPGLLAGRLTSRPGKHLQIGAGLEWRPRPLNAWWEELRFYYKAYDRGLAYGTDVTLSFERVTVRAEWVAGDRTDNDVMVPLMERRGDARKFMSAWAMILFRFQVGQVVIRPVGRAEWLDTDLEHDTGGIVHMTAALNVDLSPRMRILADVSRHFVQIGTRNWEFNVVRYDTDSTSGVLQLQLAL
jgi:hypothetical protein